MSSHLRIYAMYLNIRSILISRCLGSSYGFHFFDIFVVSVFDCQNFTETFYFVDKIVDTNNIKFAMYM